MKKKLILIVVGLLVLVASGLAVTLLVFLGGAWAFQVETARLTRVSCVDRSAQLVVNASPATIPVQLADDVENAASAAGIPVAVLAAQIDQESGWDPGAVSPAGARGIAQFMPSTWAQYGEGDITDPEDSIAAQGRYMGAIMDLDEPHADTPDEQLRLALAAYNWGPGSMESNGWSLDGLPAETRNYLAAIADTGQNWYSTDCTRPLDLENIGDLGPGEWTSPLPGGTMTGAGAFGRRAIAGYAEWANDHVGIDLATGGAGDVVAPVDLRVTALYGIDGCVLAKATTGPDFGFAFCHLDQIHVSVGDELSRGDVLGVEGGKAGNLGGRSVVHLHFEMYHPDAPDPTYPGHGNQVIDPTPILREKGAL